MDPAARSLLLLWGFMGSGKSTIGRELAARAGVPFVDLDEALESRASMSIADIFAKRGEPFFRELEKRALEELLDEGGKAVVALGGGALLDERLRARSLAEAFVVTLTAPFEVLAARLEGTPRPLASRAAALFEERRSAYLEAHRTVDTSGDDVGVIVETLLNTWSGWRGA